MHPLIDEILSEMKDELGISKYELERMIDCQFKCVEENIKGKVNKTVNLIYIGKFTPTTWFKYYGHKFINKQEDETEQA